MIRQLSTQDRVRTETFGQGETLLVDDPNTKSPELDPRELRRPVEDNQTVAFAGVSTRLTECPRLPTYPPQTGHAYDQIVTSVDPWNQSALLC